MTLLENAPQEDAMTLLMKLKWPGIYYRLGVLSQQALNTTMSTLQNNPELQRALHQYGVLTTSVERNLLGVVALYLASCDTFSTNPTFAANDWYE
eukprot:13111693-Ditylum_brightwellii.AAC.1